jgi:hypothetical protein
MASQLQERLLPLLLLLLLLRHWQQLVCSYEKE